MREETIDIAKGIGIFLVVLGHFAVFASPLYHYIYLFHMPLFFFLSGMFFKVDNNIKTTLIRKSKRLLFPYIFYWIFCHIITFLCNIVLLKDKTIDFNPFNGGVLWFLISLWTIHLICIVVERYRKHKILIYSLISIGGLVTGYNEIRLPLYLSQSMLMLPFFLAGNYSYRKKIRNKVTIYQYIQQQTFISPIFISAIIIYFFIPCDLLDLYGPIIPHNIIQYILTPLSGIIITLIMSNRGMQFFKLIHINKIGYYSLHILGIHSPFINIFWIFTIPLVLKIMQLYNVQLTSIEIKNNIAIQFILSILLTYLSYIIGKNIQRLCPKIFGQ